MNQLQARTRSRLDKVRDPKRSKLTASREIQSTRIAYDARRDPNVSSGEYDFAFRSKPFLVPILSVSEFEQLIARARPRLVKEISRRQCGRQKRQSLEHRELENGCMTGWLRSPRDQRKHLRACRSLPKSNDAFAPRRKPNARSTHLCQAAGKPLPDWWTGGWRNAVFSARVP